MIYMKTPTGKRVPVPELNFVTICPMCGKEVPVPKFFELYVDMQGDFDEYSTLYCDECSKKVIEQQQRGN